MPFDSITSHCTLRDVAEEAGELIQVDPTSIDLFIDFEAKDMLPLNIQSAMSLSYIIEEMLESVRDIAFRNLVIAGCSLPAGVDKKFNWRVYRSRRLELAVWRELSARHAPRRFGFADYGVVFAFESDPQKNVRPPARIVWPRGTNIYCGVRLERTTQSCAFWSVWKGSVTYGALRRF